MRVFVAVEISNNQVINAISKFQSEVNFNAKPVEPHNLHFTLQFLGEISEEMTEKVKAVLQKIDFLKFQVNFLGIGAFPKPKFPRVVWIGTDDDGGKALSNLAKKVEGVLAPIGFINDKQFKPHITVFRIKNKIGDITEELKKFESLNFGSQVVADFKLKQSVLTPKGPIYSDLMEVQGK